MKDRVPTPGQEGRVKITPESGGAAYYAKLEMADNPTQVGDEPIKANLLPDDVASALGLTGNAQVKDALLRVAPWRLLTIYDVAGAYVFDPADFPGVSEIGAFIIGAGASGTAAVGNANYLSIGGASGRTRAIIRKAPFLTTFSLVVGQGGVAVTTSGNNISGKDGSSSAFDGVTASGGKKGDFDTKESLVPAGGQAPLILAQGPDANVTRPPFAFGEVISTTMGYGGRVRQNPMFPNECLNPFDGKRICIAGGSRYRNGNSNLVYEESIAITDDYGNTGSVVAFSASGNVIAIKGTSYGCGGGAALAANGGTATSAAGCDGAVLIYGR